MARKYSRDNIGRFASGGGGRSSGGATGGGGAAGGKKKAAAPVAAAPKKKHPGPPPPAWSKEMLAAKAKGDRASNAKAATKPAAAKPAAAKPTKAKGEPKTRKPANTIKPSSLFAAEKAYGEIKAQKSKFRSDKKVREEMIRRGFLKGSDPQGKLIDIARKYRMRRGGAY